ncbi:sugar ABC transporter substrate-binding protein [Aureimonas flava]|uniref:Sugar ABC transporter substrate-binding protein n=1 Tax=Aureimonas flava TaxID=2320271 RepID=A0A3A1WGJ8_9HYPH|nr:sugar ABC transporter substrate-binding protein [Aureimonas flava]RIX97417.1 sugar ABC transporter substrate-binding protein [Aureimonas flava]
MTINRREVLAGLAVSTLVGRLSLTSAQAADAISYWHHFTSQSEFAGLEAVIKLFEATSPGFAVRQENIPQSDYMAKISAAILSGSRPDTAMVIADRFPDILAMDGLVDIRARVDAWDLQKNFPDNRWEAMREGEKIYAVPAYAFVDWMYYRTDYFEEAGISAPPKNYVEFLETAKKLTDPSKGRYGFGLRGGAGAFKYVIDVMEAFGSPIVEDGQPAIDRAAAIEAVTYYSSLFVKDKVAPPSAPNDGYRQIMEAFRTGQTAMVWHHTGSLNEISAALKPGEQFSTAPMPAGPKAHIARTSFAGNAIMNDAHADEAWKWISFWGQTDAAIALLQATGYFPASAAALEDERIKSNPLYAAAIETLGFGRLPNRFLGLTAWTENTVNPTFQQVLIGQTTPEAAVDAMIEGLDAAMR